VVERVEDASRGPGELGDHNSVEILAFQ
jgi:hypothetical protein